MSSASEGKSAAIIEVTNPSGTGLSQPDAYFGEGRPWMEITVTQVGGRNDDFCMDRPGLFHPSVNIKWFVLRRKNLGKAKGSPLRYGILTIVPHKQNHLGYVMSWWKKNASFEWLMEYR